MPEQEAEVVNPYKCQLVTDYFVDPVGEGAGDQGAIVRTSLDCPLNSPLRFTSELRQVQVSNEIETALADLRSAIAKEIYYRCTALQAARDGGKVAEFIPPEGIS